MNKESQKEEAEIIKICLDLFVDSGLKVTSASDETTGACCIFWKGSPESCETVANFIESKVLDYGMD